MGEQKEKKPPSNSSYYETESIWVRKSVCYTFLFQCSFNIFAASSSLTSFFHNSHTNFPLNGVSFPPRVISGRFFIINILRIISFPYRRLSFVLVFFVFCLIHTRCEPSVAKRCRLFNHCLCFIPPVPSHSSAIIQIPYQIMLNELCMYMVFDM